MKFIKVGYTSILNRLFKEVITNAKCNVIVAFIEEFRGDIVGKYVIGIRGYNYSLYALKPINVFYSIENR